jgi:hypothetical protein
VPIHEPFRVWRLLGPVAHKRWTEAALYFLELRFGEVRVLGILGSSLPTSNAQVTAKIAHLSDTPAPIREYGTHVTDKGTP